MTEIPYEEIIAQADITDAILHTHEPFVKDYLTLHALLRIHDISDVLEIGTHIGEGTNIICNAVPDALVSSLDLPVSQGDKTMQHPKHKQKKIGEMCQGHVQLLGDSMTFIYSEHEAWFIDGEHDYAHARHETKEAFRTKAKLVIWHDADMIEVWNAINDSLEWNKFYDLYRITGTRIAFALKNNL